MSAKPNCRVDMKLMRPLLGFMGSVVLVLAGNPMATGDEQSVEKHRSRVRQMSLSEKASLRIKRRRFQGLSAERKAELRQLHAAMETHSELKQPMRSYSEWLATLSPSQLAELQHLPPSARIEKIKQFRRHQAPGTPTDLPVPQLSDIDTRGVMRWTHRIMMQKHHEIQDSLPAAMRQRIAAELDPETRAQMLLHAALNQQLTLPVLDGEVKKLGQMLSPEARHLLEQAGSHESRQRLLKTWINGSLRKPMKDGHDRRRFKEFPHKSPKIPRQFSPRPRRKRPPARNP